MGKNAGTNRQAVSDHFDHLPALTWLCALHQERARAARLPKVRMETQSHALPSKSENENTAPADPGLRAFGL